MKYKSKKDQLEDYIKLEILHGNLKNGSKINDKKFFTSKFKINPVYVDQCFDELIDSHILESKSDGLYIRVDEEEKANIRYEYLHSYINEFLQFLEDIDISLDEAIEHLKLRNLANG